ncbi:MAG: molybdenum cofactor guanylyltransferase [Chloroflexi bacterium]|nr:molybdenum cofactor guanylyltransferase [Chloroflexota bacterium]
MSMDTGMFTGSKGFADGGGVWGLVLAGGSSSRMGQDKALLSLGGKPLIEHVIQRIKPLVAGVSLVVNEPETYRFLGLPIVRDPEPHQGPLMGLYAGLMACPTPWALVVACDTPFLQEPLLRKLLDGSEDKTVVVTEVGGERQPLPALYAAFCAADIGAMLQAGRRALRDLVSSVPVRVIQEAEVRALDPEMHSFLDLDTAEELRKAEELYSGGAQGAEHAREE